jgi:hypothetical protein
VNNTLRCLRPLASIASIVLFIYVLQQTGPRAVLDKIRLVGWDFLVLMLLSGVRHVLRAVAWSYCVQTDGPRPGPLSLLGPRLMGDALNDLTPAGPLLGEPAKVAIVSELVPAQAGASSVVLENLIYVLAGLLFMLTGIVTVLAKLGTLQGFRWIGGGLVICFVAWMAMLWLIVTRRILLLGGALDYLKGAGLRWAFLERHQQRLRAMEQAIHDFFLTRKRVFLVVLAIEMATNFTGVAEAYLILKVTAAHASFSAAYLVESASRAVQFAFSFIPLGLGIQEGAAAATLQAVGYAASAGVSLAIIRKIRTVLWIGVGLLFAAKYSISLPVGEKSAI